MNKKYHVILFLLSLLVFVSYFGSKLFAEKNYLEGQLLVASPGMSDLRFAETVILICQHNNRGALGLVLNRPAGQIKISKLLESLDITSSGINGDIQVRLGGPLATDTGFLMYSDEYESEKNLCNKSGVTVTSNKEVLKRLKTVKYNNNLVLFFGYAGWGPNQLETELASEDWITVPADTSILFDQDINSLWKKARARHTIDL